MAMLLISTKQSCHSVTEIMKIFTRQPNAIKNVYLHAHSSQMKERVSTKNIAKLSTLKAFCLLCVKITFPQTFVFSTATLQEPVNDHQLNLRIAWCKSILDHTS
jgi:hypothetical protein